MPRPEQELNPLAFAVAAGCTELVAVLLVGFPMAGMMSGGYGMMQGGWGFGYGIVWWFGGALLAALAGAVFAWIYNAVAAAKPSRAETSERRSGDV
jgi:hypothetical protein